MAITKSAKKSLRQNIKRKARNLIYKTEMKKTLKKVISSVSQKKIEEAKKMLPQAYKILDKAAKAGVIKKNTASRKKSRLARLIARTSS